MRITFNYSWVRNYVSDYSSSGSDSVKVQHYTFLSFSGLKHNDWFPINFLATDILEWIKYCSSFPLLATKS